MRILLVEDDERVIELLRDALSPPRHEVVEARSRDSAANLLEREEFDLVLCDLKIPTIDGALDAQPEHGEAIFRLSRKLAPGTPIRYLTAFGTLDLISASLAEAPTLDVFGTRQDYPMGGWFGKDDFGPCLSGVAEVAAHLEDLEQIDVVAADIGADPLSPYQKRVIRIFARRCNGTVVKVVPIKGGLSGALTLRAQVFDAYEKPIVFVVAKIADLDQIGDERARFHQFVPRLNAGSYAPLADEVLAGACRTGALYYRLAEDHDRHLFDVLATDDATAAQIVGALEAIQEPWRRGEHATRRSVGELRRQIIDDNEIATLAPKLQGIAWQTAEQRVIQVRELCQHGDLHGLNVLVDHEARPLMIDYGDVAMSFSARDPVALELSVVFHPDRYRLVGDWPTVQEANSWAVRSKYLTNCPVPAFVQACHDWALRASFTRHSVYAAGYVYALKQLRYEDTNHDVAVAMISAAVEGINQL